MSQDKVCDEELVERFQSGDKDAFNEIDHRFRFRLIRFIQQRLKSIDIAEEITQEVLARAFNTLGGLQNRAYLSPWLYKIAYRCCVDWVRKNHSYMTSVVSYDETSENNTSHTDEGKNSLFNGLERRPNGVAFSDALPEEIVQRTEEYENIWQVALETLSKEEYQILWLKYVEEASDLEISLRIGKRLGTIRVALTRIRKKLAERMKFKQN